MMFVERENGRDELQKVFREELAVFCEDASSEYYEQRLFRGMIKLMFVAT